jgi:hypothetical protein
MTTEIKWSLRQNMWKVSTGIIDTIQTTKVIICPGYHNRESCPEQLIPEELRQKSSNKAGNRFINDIKVGHYAIIFVTGNKSPLCVRITSETYRKEIPEITIYKKYGHRNSYNTEEVEVCLTGQNITGRKKRDYTHTEKMVAYVRDVEIIGILNYQIYPELINKYKILQRSIAENKLDCRFITI